MKRVFGVFAVIMVMSMTSCSGIMNSAKGFQADTMGLDRNIYISMDDGTTFVYSGSNIKVDSTEYGNKVIVTINGKRLNTYNASVIVEEKGLEPTAVFGPGELAKIK